MRYRLTSKQISAAGAAAMAACNFNQTYPRPTTAARKNSGIVSGRDGARGCGIVILNEVKDPA